MDLELLTPLAESIFEYWDSESFDEGLLVNIGMGSVKEEIYMY